MISIDCVLVDILCGKKILTFVGIEGSEFMILQGSDQTLLNQPCPVWLMDILSTEHQHAGVAINPNFVRTFELFFAQGYLAFTLVKAAIEIRLTIRQKVVAGLQGIATLNVILNPSDD